MSDVRMVETVAEFRAQLGAARRSGQSVGLVPTMGALHAGHRALIERAASECDVVAVSIFVNPLQFGQTADIENYPRTQDADLGVCEEAGAAVVFVPTVTEMYPNWPEPVATTVSVSGLSTILEGASRPGHFDGVTTVVAKLFAMAGPCRAYFGEKDFQQLAVVSTMVRDLSLGIELVRCATVREADGLALSSRNVRLSVEERAAAVVLSRALSTGRRAIEQGETDPTRVRAAMAECVATESLVHLDYGVVVDAGTLSVPDTLVGEDLARLRLLIAATVGPVRLIDNTAVLTPIDGNAEAQPHDERALPSRQFERIG